MPSADLPKTYPMTVRLDAAARGLLDAAVFTTGRSMSDLLREGLLARALAELDSLDTKEETSRDC